MTQIAEKDAPPRQLAAKLPHRHHCACTHRRHPGQVESRRKKRKRPPKVRTSTHKADTRGNKVEASSTTNHRRAKPNSTPNANYRACEQSQTTREQREEHLAHVSIQHEAPKAPQRTRVARNDAPPRQLAANRPHRHHSACRHEARLGQIESRPRRGKRCLKSDTRVLL